MVVLFKVDVLFKVEVLFNVEDVPKRELLKVLVVGLELKVVLGLELRLVLLSELPMPSS